MRTNDDDWTSERERDYDGSIGICARALSRREMPLAQSGNGGGSKRIQAAQNFYGIEPALLADIGGQNHPAVHVGAGWVFRLDGNNRERTTLGGISFWRIGGFVFVIVSCSGSGRYVRLWKLECNSNSCLDYLAVIARREEGPGVDRDKSFVEERRLAAHDLDVGKPATAIDERIEHDFSAEERLRGVSGGNQRKRGRR